MRFMITLLHLFMMFNYFDEMYTQLAGHDLHTSR
jgi:hypothetical protein